MWAKRVISAVEENSGRGAFSLDGKMIDEPIIKRAKRYIASYNSEGEING
ncbi:MAG: hypothetical protein ACK5NF_06040 [Bacilli bacterium]